jgi:hypothetical protein
MEGGGAYNRHSMLQAAGIASALPLLEKAVLNVSLEADSHPVVIADYGSSEGKNSLTPMRLAIETIRRRADPKRPILVFHVDQPANDFNSLFALLNTDEASYGLEPNVFSSAVGRSFYGSVLPPGHVYLGWSSYAAHWLSKVPTTIPDHFHSTFSSGAVLAEFDRQAALDWKAFLSLRANELRSGGRLLVVQPALDDDGRLGNEDLYNHANGLLAEMADGGEIKPEERARMVLGVYPRRRRDLLAPFEQEGEFQQLTVEDCELSLHSDAAWADYERDHNRDVWASRQARFFRATFPSSLMLGLTNAGDADKRHAFADQLEDRLKRRLVSHPAPLRSFATTIVLAKR